MTAMKALFTIILVSIAFINVPAQGNIIRQNRQLAPFTAIKASSGWDVIVRQGDHQSVSLEATKEVLDNAVIEVKNSTLHIYNKSNSRIFSFRNLQNNPRKAYITVKNLHKVEASGGVDFRFETPVKTEDFEVNLSGGSDLKNLSLECNRFVAHFSGGCDAGIQFNAVESIKVNMSGGCDIKLRDISGQTTRISASGGSDLVLTGKTDILNLVVSGGCDVSASKLIARKGDLNFSGASDGAVHVKEYLDISLSGSADVTCYGNPKDVNKKIDRSSSLNLR